MNYWTRFEPYAQNLQVLKNEPMSRYTSFKIGGPADLMVIPETEEQLVAAVHAARNAGIPWTVIGNGSNLLVSDKGIRGVVIVISERLGQAEINGTVLTAGAGILLSRLASTALKAALTGLEFAAGIPGTLGGAVYMNAGAYGGEMKQVVTRTRYLDEDGQIRVAEGVTHEFAYRHSCFSGTSRVILSVEMQLGEGDAAAIRTRMDELALARRTKQPLHMPSAGSVFKRPEGYFAGKLIEDCGLRGFSMGGAQVSELHCGFIVNTGEASAQNVRDLIAHIQAKVMQQFGVQLETEIRWIGET